MKLTVQCKECFDQASRASFAPAPKSVEQQIENIKGFIGYEVELKENFTYEFKCEKGHQQIAILKTPRFEILMQIAMSAILDGYYREAVASAASALERFYDYYLNVQSISNGCDRKLFKKLWKNLKSRSERQIGTYLMICLFNEQESPLTLEVAEKINKRNPAQFRNEVIHNGLMPTRDESIQFGNRVISLILPMLNKLRQANLEYIEEFEDEEYKKWLDEAKIRKGNQKIIWYRHHPVFGPSHMIIESQPKVEEVLVQLDTFRQLAPILNRLH